jgi:hypothetical protein
MADQRENLLFLTSGNIGQSEKIHLLFLSPFISYEVVVVRLKMAGQRENLLYLTSGIIKRSEKNHASSLAGF